MLQPTKKIAKKEIKQDALLTAYANATTFYEANKKYVTYGVTALVAIVIAVVVFMNNRKANNEKAASELGRVFAIYDAAATDVRQFKIAIDGQPERGIMGLKAIVDNYGSTAAGEMARIYLANAYYATGQYDQALQQYDSFGGSGDLLKAAAYAGMAMCYEVKHEYSKAASSYEKAASVVSNTTDTPEYLGAAGRCYGLAGEKEKAVMLFKRIKKEFPLSNFARDVERYISQFSA